LLVLLDYLIPDCCWLPSAIHEDDIVVQLLAVLVVAQVDVDEFGEVEPFDTDAQEDFILAAEFVEELLPVDLELLVEDSLVFVDFGEGEFHEQIERKEIDEGNQWRDCYNILTQCFNADQAVEGFTVLVDDVVLVPLVDISELEVEVLSHSVQMHELEVH
jgi:hypothetical protein